MDFEGQIVCARALKDGLDLPAGGTVSLKPGGVHPMSGGCRNADDHRST